MIPIFKDETHYFRDQTSVFCNKYEEDLNVPTVANQLANIISEVEVYYSLDIDDEIDNDEMSFEDMIYHVENEESFVEDEVFKEAEFFAEISETEIENISKQSSGRNRSTLEKVSKIPVAPGEKGKFKNWGEDVFLEEKCFQNFFHLELEGI